MLRQQPLHFISVRKYEWPAALPDRRAARTEQQHIVVQGQIGSSVGDICPYQYKHLSFDRLGTMHYAN